MDIELGIGVRLGYGSLDSVGLLLAVVMVGSLFVSRFSLLLGVSFMDQREMKFSILTVTRTSRTVTPRALMNFFLMTGGEVVPFSIDFELVSRF